MYSILEFMYMSDMSSLHYLFPRVTFISQLCLLHYCSITLDISWVSTNFSAWIANGVLKMSIFFQEVWVGSSCLFQKRQNKVFEILCFKKTFKYLFLPSYLTYSQSPHAFLFYIYVIVSCFYSLHFTLCSIFYVSALSSSLP